MNRTGKMISVTFGIVLFYLRSVRAQDDIFSINAKDVVWIPKPMSSSDHCDNGMASMYGFSLAIDSDTLFIFMNNYGRLSNICPIVINTIFNPR